MIYKVIIHDYRLKEKNCRVTPFRNRSSFFTSICSFNDGLLRAINNASRHFSSDDH